MKINYNEDFKKNISERFFDEDLILNKDKSFRRISIIVPSYNQGQFLERTILSILNQNYPNLELVIIDGGSTDNSVNIIKKYEKYIDYWVSEKDRGQSDALNKGFLKATGEIIGWQNSDDIYLPGCFLKVAELFRNSPKVDIIYGNRFDINKEDKIIGRSVFTRFSSVVYRYDGMPLGTQSVFWRKNLFSKIGMLDIDFNLAMDYEFFMRAAVRGVRFKNVPYYFGAMRRHDSAKTEMFLGLPPHKKECSQIDQKYNRKKWLNLPLKIYSLSFRIVNYYLQGDFDYVFDGLIRRIKNKTLLSGK